MDEDLRDQKINFYRECFSKRNGILCPFTDRELYKVEDLYFLPYSDIAPHVRKPTEEAEDWLEEFRFMVIPKGTTLCHSTKIDDMYRYVGGKGIVVNKDVECWFSKTLPGQLDYGGGWFTYERPMDVIDFGVNLYYKTSRNVPVIFIPNIYDDLMTNSEYFDPTFQEYWDNQFIIRHLSRFYSNSLLEDLLSALKAFEEINYPHVDDFLEKIRNIDPELEEKEKKDQIVEYINELWLKASLKLREFDEINKYKGDGWKGSHLIQGVKNWKNKGYEMISHPDSSYADELGKRMVKLGFNGYVSCDECEVFLTYEAMRDCLEGPYFLEVTEVSSDRYSDEDIELIKKHLIKCLEKVEVNKTITTMKNRYVKSFNFENLE